ncbi:four helix bundle protein [Pirellulales bacterium]|nr:four helix bundle protein [Pirellulales bacterium]
MDPVEMSERLLDFAARVAKVADSLPDTRLGRHVAGQMIRSGTSPVANYEEGCAAESRKDFAHKLSICLKEVRETHVWLKLTVRTDLVPKQRLEDLIDEAGQLSRILGKSVATAKGTQRQPEESEHALPEETAR